MQLAPELRDDLLLKSRCNHRIQIIRNARADERYLPRAVPVMNKARHHRHALGIAEHEDLQNATAEMRPPGEKPLRGLERSQPGARPDKVAPLRSKVVQPASFSDYFNTQPLGLDE